MLPERNKIKHTRLKMEIAPSSRSEMKPHCLGLWAGCRQLGNNTTTTTGSSIAQMASTKTDLLQLFGELPWQETKNTEKHSQETDIRKEAPPMQAFVVYKH